MTSMHTGLKVTICFCLFFIWAGDVWIVGDSIIRRAQHSLQCYPLVRWNGKGGARLNDLTGLLSELAVSGPPPGLIIVHIGTNDLVPLDAFCIRQSLRIFMEECCARFPGAQLVWSDILPRACFFGAFSQAKMEMKRRSINKWARKVGRRIGVAVLNHLQFKWSLFHLFRYDGVHLSQVGLELFRKNLLDCITGYFVN